MRIIVCLPSREATRVEDAVAEAMAPFELDYRRGEDLDIWDTWRITEGLPVLAGFERDSRLVHHSPTAHHTDGRTTTLETIPSEYGWCAGGPRALLDLPTSQVHLEQTRALADAIWQRWHELATELPTALARDSFYESHFCDIDADTCEACEQISVGYSAQPLVRAFGDYLGTLSTTRGLGGPAGTYDPVITIDPVTRDEFVGRAVKYALPQRNILSLSGWWYEDGWTGIHGACHSPADCPHTPDLAPGYEHIADYLASLPADTLLFNVRCHV
ncbi:hypothetical protein [Nocardia sp. NPDC051981]|uniref:hypothetical protein n=1 Tax=Nocardia sp. NPDC051981 TaxID=3155417 RepID=UPI003422408F